MTARFHPQVQNDIRGILRHYRRVSGLQLAEEFFAEFEQTLDDVITNPRSCHFDTYSGWRRANLSRFPHHFLYEERLGHVFVLVLRFNGRRPSYGLRRIKRPL